MVDDSNLHTPKVVRTVCSEEQSFCSPAYRRAFHPNSTLKALLSQRQPYKLRPSALKRSLECFETRFQSVFGKRSVKPSCLYYIVGDVSIHYDMFDSRPQVYFMLFLTRKLTSKHLFGPERLSPLEQRFFLSIFRRQKSGKNRSRKDALDPITYHTPVAL